MYTKGTWDNAGRSGQGRTYGGRNGERLISIKVFSGQALWRELK
jgi:hypothetical protein